MSSSRVSTSRLRLGSSSIIVSVTSSSSSSAGTPVSASRCATRSGKPGSSRLRTARFTATGHVEPGVEPFARLLERCPQHEQRERLDQPGALRQRDELAGRHEPALRVRPAHQRLDAAQLAAPDRDLRLVVKDQLLRVERGAQSGHHPESLRAVRVVLRRVDHLAGVRALGLVHADVGLPDERLRSSPWSGYSAIPMLASTCTRTPSSAIGSASAACSRSAARRAANSSSTRGRIIANSSPPSRAIVSASRRVARRRSPTSLQEPVPLMVAERVVHLLEAVEVEQQHGHARPTLAPRHARAPGRACR